MIELYDDNKVIGAKVRKELRRIESDSPAQREKAERNSPQAQEGPSLGRKNLEDEEAQQEALSLTGMVLALEPLIS